MKAFNFYSGVVNHPEFGKVEIIFNHTEVGDNFNGSIEIKDPRVSLPWIVLQVQKCLIEYNNRGNKNNGNMYFIHDLHVNPIGVNFNGKIKKIADIL